MRKMRYILIFSCSIFFSRLIYAQQVTQVKISGATNFSSFSLTTDQKVIINISPAGDIMEWGIDAGPTRYGNSIPGTLQPYMGRVEYYRNDEYDSLLRGKVRSIGTTNITYYPATDMPERAGKIRTIGSVLFEYYSNYVNESLRGKLKFAGAVLFDYYSSFENELVRGKLKSVGNTLITYYTTFDEKAVQGKIKNLGNILYTWKDRGFTNGWTTVTMTPVFNGVTYILY